MMEKYDNEQEFIKLADDMEAHPDNYGAGIADIDIKRRERVISDLRDMEYHDFENERYASPKLQMARDFEALGRHDIVGRIQNGDFDQ